MANAEILYHNKKLARVRQRLTDEFGGRYARKIDSAMNGVQDLFTKGFGVDKVCSEVKRKVLENERSVSNFRYSIQRSPQIGYSQTPEPGSSIHDLSPLKSPQLKLRKHVDIPKRFKEESTGIKSKIQQIRRNFPAVRPIEYSSKIDQLNQVKVQRDGYIWYQNKLRHDFLERVNIQRRNKEALDKQVQEKRIEKQRLINEEKEYGKKLAQRYDQMKIFQSRKNVYHNQARREYGDLLKQQMNYQSEIQQKLKQVTQEARRINQNYASMENLNRSNRKNLRSYELSNHRDLDIHPYNLH